MGRIITVMTTTYGDSGEQREEGASSPSPARGSHGGPSPVGDGPVGVSLSVISESGPLPEFSISLEKMAPVHRVDTAGLEVLSGLIALAKAGVTRAWLREDVWEAAWWDICEYRMRWRMPLPERGPVLCVRNMRVMCRG